MGTRKCPNLKILSIVVTLRIIKNRRREKSLCLLLSCLAGTPLPGSFWELLLELLGPGIALQSCVCRVGWAAELQSMPGAPTFWEAPKSLLHHASITLKHVLNFKSSLSRAPARGVPGARCVPGLPGLRGGLGEPVLVSMLRMCCFAPSDTQCDAAAQ